MDSSRFGRLKNFFKMWWQEGWVFYTYGAITFINTCVYRPLHKENCSHLLCRRLRLSSLNLSLSSNQQTKDHAAEEILKDNPLGHQSLGLLPMISDIQFLSWSLLQLPLKSVGISLSTSVGAGSGFSHFPLGLARDANVRDAAGRAPDGRK